MGHVELAKVAEQLERHKMLARVLCTNGKSVEPLVGARALASGTMRAFGVRSSYKGRTVDA